MPGPRVHGQQTAAQLIDRYDLACSPVRDLLADYLNECLPVLIPANRPHQGIDQRADHPPCIAAGDIRARQIRRSPDRSG